METMTSVNKSDRIDLSSIAGTPIVYKKQVFGECATSLSLFNSIHINMSQSPKSPASVNEPVNPPTEDSRDLAMQFAQQLSVAGSGANTPKVSPSVAKDYALLRDPSYHNKRVEAIRQKKGYIIDMDGVIYHVS